MSRSRPASNPISFHKHTKQYYVTRGGKRIYLGADREEALKKYHRIGLGFEPIQQEPAMPVEITIKELANRFMAAQQANWVWIGFGLGLDWVCFFCVFGGINYHKFLSFQELESVLGFQNWLCFP